ncbi:hypothetical protein KC921_04415 [Candidatus Woesebacteria bacterium]|nr:hypothetical protein [Candidatus Woesebacteria bacterium]
MSQPSFSYHFELSLTLEQAWSFFTDLAFWKKSWHGLADRFTLSEPLRLGSKGVLSLIEGENWEIVLTDFRPALSLTFQLRSASGKVSLEYRLTQQIQPVVSVTVKLEQFKHDSQDIVSTLINPIITKHLNLFHQLLDSEIPQAHKEDTPNEQAEPKSAPAQSSPPVDDSALQLLDVQAGFRLWQLANVWQSKIRSILKPYQLSPTQWLLLYALVRLEKHPEPMTPSLLSSLLELNAVLVSDVINALVKKHLVHKIKILPDKRSFMINATAEGKITAIEAHTAVVQANKKFFSPDPLNKIQQLLAPK